jgi:hypothetical protein
MMKVPKGRAPKISRPASGNQKRISEWRLLARSGHFDVRCATTWWLEGKLVKEC